ELLADFVELDGVDELDATTRTPSLADLTPYQAVILIAQTPFSDPEALGDVLASYVDRGGGLVLTLASFVDGWQVRGRLLRGGYVPLNLGSGPFGSSTLGTFNASHPILAGVTRASGDLLARVGLAPQAELVASWANGTPLVATKGTVAAINV